MQSRRLEFYVCLFLIVAILAVYGQVFNHGFVNYDDPGYVTQNPWVQKGLTLEGVSRAFTATDTANWHPLTWLSHMTDCQLFGLNPGMHHLSSLLFHIINTLLLFVVFRMMTGALWQSAFVAALFALHPLHVESVAWVAERKDVLSTLFWMLTMWGYVRYVRRPGIGRYLPVLLFFIMGLMAKPMVVTLPFVLLLMDYWPLGRFRLDGAASGGWPVLFRLVREKAPLFILSAASGVVTFLVQQGAGAVSSMEMIPLKIRAANALVSYASYLGKMIWPHKLAVFYPHPGILPVWQAAGAVALLLVVSLLVLRVVKRYPYFAVGWLWYIGTLVPVIGLVQVGGQSMADRYTYLPLIGIGIILAWGVPEVAARWHRHRAALAAGAVSVIMVLMAVTWVQARYWKNSVTLFQHALDVTANNYIAHNNLGAAMGEQGNTEKAIEHYYEALRLNHKMLQAHNNLGSALVKQGKVAQAIKHYSAALRINPGDLDARLNLGNVLAGEGRMEEAMVHYSEALRIKPNYSKAHYNIGVVLVKQGNATDAMDHFYEALRIDPGYAMAHIALGNVLLGQGRVVEAARHYSEAVRIRPGDAQAHFNLGLALTRQGSFGEAAGHYSEAMRLDPDFASSSLYNIACVYAMQNRPEESIDSLREAIKRGFNDWDLIKTDKDLNAIRHSSYYKEMIKGH